MKAFCKVIFFFLCTQIAISAQNLTLSGYVTDESGEGIPSATVYDSLSKRGVLTNNYGFYSLALAMGEVHLRISSVGFVQRDTVFTLRANTILSPRMKTQTLAEVVIKENRYQNINKIGVITLPLAQIKRVPAIGGETDIIKALGLTPGVSNGTEGSAGLFVRGGTPDQNLILLDEAIVYNPTHIFGLLSVFNTDAVKNVELIKGGFPARYGGRLSSVLDISMREGSLEKKKTEFGIGIISSRLLLERPLVKNKLSMMLSARSAYLDLLLLPVNIIGNSGGYRSEVGFRMYDINAKLHYKINEKNSLFLSFYTGSDKLTNVEGNPLTLNVSNYGWGNSTLSLRHNATVSPKLFWRNMITWSKFQYRVRGFDEDKARKTETEFKNISGLQDLNIKTAIDYYPHQNHQIKAGLDYTLHYFNPQSRILTSTDTSNTQINDRQNIFATELSAFVEDEWKIISRLRLNAGFRFNVYNVGGKSYLSPEPRLALAYDLGNSWTIKGAYTRMQQNIHLLVNSGLGYQNDIWVPSTEGVSPQKSQQFSLGIFKTFTDWGVDASLEIYRKQMTDLIDTKEGTNIVTDLNSWERAIEVSGVGESRGIEFFLHKKEGKFNGFLSYTLAETTRQFDNINNGQVYPFRYDNRHNFALTLSYQLSKKWDFSGTFVFKTGDAITVPIYSVQRQPDDSNINGEAAEYSLWIYSTRNGYRLPNYHRADIAFNRVSYTKKGRQKKWSFSVFNLYNRANVAYVQVVNDPIYVENRLTGYSPRLKAKSLFGFIIPSFSFSKSF